MAMNFPDAPSVDDEFTVGDQTWKWTGTVWETVTITSYTPSAHATSHELGGTDELALDPTQVSGLETLNTGTAGYTALSNGASGLSYQPVSHNYILNGAFDFWQRGTSTTAPINTSTYLADRYFHNRNGSGATVTISQESFSPADIEAIGFGDAKYFYRYDQSVAGSGATYTIYGQQKIEDVGTLAGQTVTLSFWAKSNANRDVRAEIQQNFGSGGSSSVGAAQTISITTNWTRYEATINLGSMSGKTIGSNSSLNATILASSASLNTVHQVDLWGVQLEAGSVATPFKRNAPSLQGELAACQRYFQKSYRQADAIGSITDNGNVVYWAASTQNFHRATVFLKVTMRSNPTVKIYSTATGTVDKLRNENDAVDVNAFTADIAEGSFVTFVNNVSITNKVLVWHYTAESEL